MAPTKLSDSDKSEIIDLYKQPGQTTSTLAEQYGVSNSTISRILKSSIPAGEYSALIAEKRMASSDTSSTPSRRSREKKKTTPAKAVSAKTVTVPEFAPAANQPTADGTLVSEDASEDSNLAAASKVDPPKLKSTENAIEEETDTKNAAPRRRRKRSRTQTEAADEQLRLLSEDETLEDEILEDEILEDEILEDEILEDETLEDEILEVKPSKDKPSTPRPRPILASQDDDGDDDDDDDDDDDLLGLDETLGDDFGDDDDDDEEDDDIDDDDIDVMPRPKLASETAVEIMPLGLAVLPKPCYLVVDMRAELITRPLVEFSDLGKIPSAEETANTLPVFDNHRVARRFSRNKQRVIKVPDGSLITRTSPYLMAKGITRLLVDGQVFDLVGAD
ncbi:MAG: helix-turn-helix domain-containing protein [Phormidesmis sp.]